jgi:hypothetical protein
MPRYLTFNGQRKKFLIGTATPLISDAEAHIQLGEGFVTPESEIPSDQKVISASRLVDLGGVGDCLLIALNMLESTFKSLTSRPAHPDSNAVYRLLGLPTNTYLEDDHLNKIIDNYSFSVIVYREHKGNCYCAKYGSKPDVMYLFNDYPIHYLILDQVYLSGKMISLSDFMTTASEAQRQLNVSRYSAAEEQEHYPEVLEQVKGLSDDPEACLAEDVDLRYLYQYVDTRYSIKKNNLALAGRDSKVYYKLRHNVFKTKFLNMLGLESTDEQPFSIFGIDSTRTPDFLAMIKGKLVLIEFTVVKKFSTSLKTKQSRNKYASEVEIAAAKGVTILQHYPTLSLDEGVTGIKVDLYDLANILEKEIFEDPDVVFSDMQRSLNELEFNISELMGELLRNDEEFEGVQLQTPPPDANIIDYFKEIERPVGAKRLRDQNAFNMIKRKSRQLERQLKTTRYQAKFVLVINTTFNSVYADVDPTGMPKNALLSCVQNLSPDLMKIVRYDGTSRLDEEPFKLYGSPKFVLGTSRKQKHELIINNSDFESYYTRKLYLGAQNKEMSTLVDHKLEDQAPLLEDHYMSRLKALREEKDIQVVDRNWFTFPCATECSKGAHEPLNLSTGLPITDRLIRQAHPQKMELTLERKHELEKLDEALLKVNKAQNKLLAELGNDRRLARLVRNNHNKSSLPTIIPKASDLQRVSDALEEWRLAKRGLTTEIDEPTRKAYRNRVTIPRHMMKHDWPSEMQHFNKKKGPVRICSDEPLPDLQEKVDSLLSLLWCEKSIATVDDTHSETVPMGTQLKSTLTQMKELISPTLDSLKHTYIMHDLELISRLAYTVMFYSNIKSNKDDFFHDNLGYKDVMVFVKGGKKILSTKRSRLFKLYFPINPATAWIYKSSSFRVSEVSGKTYCITPWQNWTFVKLKRASELYYTFSNYFCSSYIESGLELEVYKKFISCKVLNMYSQRRKVEIWFGFFRYIYLNSMAEYTSLMDLINDMVDYEYDPYFSYCQKSFAKNYINIYSNSKDGRLYDMVTGVLVENFDLCAEKFDESILMTVAPFDAVNEHLRNLKSVLKIHDSVVSRYTEDPKVLHDRSIVDVYSPTYFSELSEDDLRFDPRLAVSVGKFTGEYLSRSVTKESLSENFGKIMSNTYTEISTSKGMRSSKGEFWGQKGHDVVFGEQELINALKEFTEGLPKTAVEYKGVVRATHTSFKDKIEVLKNPKLEFDLKDKAQWKGSREIYVMSDATKLLQSPLEKFFKTLCTWMPNELIHKKSHVRPKFIHSQVFEFEYGDDICTYATLDCRKWAPKSNLWKYQYFMKGLSPYLPESFNDYFEGVWSLMHKKRIRIQSRYYDLLKCNPANEKLISYLKRREDGDYELIMHYSFMMGIFNYLSSLVHAATQLYFDTKVSRPLGVSFNLLAHSDDSGGAIFSRSWEQNIFLFRQYEMFQKGMNHLMSKKKCALSRNFFEMISIMYANKRLIPMTHKFLANVGFEPKGKGWVDDISTIVSKVVELFSNGGTMTQCYYTMISMSEMIRKFYHIPRIKTLSSLPLVYGGLFNMHPLHLILLGADAQEIMLDSLETAGERGFRVNIAEALFGEYFPGKGPVANYHIPYYKKHQMAYLFDKEAGDLLKLYSSVEKSETLGQTAGHYSRLQDPAYVYSLTGVDMTQIFIMTIFTKTMVLTSKGEKKADLRRLCLKYSALKALSVYTKRTTKNHSHFLGYMKASESVKVDVDSMTIASNKTCKPLVYTTFQSMGLGLNHQLVNEIVAYRKEPKLHFLFPDKVRMDTLTNWVVSNLRFKNDYILEDYLMKLSSKDMEKTRSSYCFIPSGISVDTPERFWTYINFYCTRRYYISSNKPQYFTMDQFQLWNPQYENLKHMYLLVKISLRCPLKKSVFDKLRKNSECSHCGYSSQINSIVTEIYRLRTLPSYSFFETLLPYAVYNTPQRKAVNVWYGSSEFTLYTQFGIVEVTKRLGDYHHIYYLDNTEFLDQVYFLLQNFMTTRGLHMLQATYSVNDADVPKLGFGDLNQPKLVYPGERSMMMQKSLVMLKPLNINKLYKDGDKFTMDGDTVDFEIYQNYDLNPGFYKTHSLHEIKDLIFDNEVSVERDSIYKNAVSSKIYNVLRSDPAQAAFGNIQEKYKNAKLLGSERSLTRALSISNQTGLTSYRSTVSPTVLDNSLFEGMSHKDIPVLDLIDQFSFARVTHKERRVMEHIVSEGEIREKDLPVLDALTAKMGIKPTLNALSVVRNVFSELSWRDLPGLDKIIVEDYLYTMLKASFESIEDRTKLSPEFALQGTKAQIAKLLNMSLRIGTSAEALGEMLTKLFIRAQKTNAPKFWELRKDNLYAAIVIPNVKSMKSQLNFHMGAITRLKKDYKKLLGLRQLRLAERTREEDFGEIMGELETQREEEPEFLASNLRLEDFEGSSYIIDKSDEEYEDAMDTFGGSEDPDFAILDREWEGEDHKTFYLFNEKDIRIVSEQTVLEDYSGVVIYSPTLLPNMKWLGPCDASMVNVCGVPFYRTAYPGSLMKIHTTKDLKPLERKRVESKPIPIISDEPTSRWAGKQKVTEDIFNLKTEEDVYEYQAEVLRNIGITDVDSHSSYFFRLADVKNEGHFWNNLLEGLNLKAIMKAKSITKTNRGRTNVLPGFTGNLRDTVLRAELNALFKGHAEEIVGGNQKLTARSYSSLLKTFRRLYSHSRDRDERGLIIILLSTMRDSVVSESSDSWYTDSLLEAVDFLEGEDSNMNADDPPPEPSGLSLNYVEVYPYDDL